ncbi:hypothetical protein [Rhodoferax saidenbachensis]|uniref:DUF2946 domain-containing protein n=1 Tax=Rhodoferax saidenbachensis TaxID=1484693 RepID=A0A1P8KCE2_9BURK|nr:hypothetical protein [Rhodoferax saidenbachensis]APW43697.1 hypothetical protein RS694_14910 [Rhodoferax saidenbachensis]
MRRTVTIPAVKRLLLILIILILPARGWAVEQMSSAMGAGNVSQAVAGDGMAAMPADCPMLAQGKASTGQDPAQNTKVCKSCQLCMGLTAHAVPVPIPPVATPMAPPVYRVQPLASADLPRDTKPPQFFI